MKKVKSAIPSNAMNEYLFNYEDDIVYHLFKYYSKSNYSRQKVLLPKNCSYSNLDYRISWILNLLLPPSPGFSSYDKTKLDNQLIHSYIYQLESIGLWVWACFVAMHLQNSAEREITIRRILGQYFPFDCNDDSVSTIFITNWNDNDHSINNNNTNGMSFIINPNKNYTNLYHFLVDKLQISKFWIHDAKRIKAKYNGDLLREICYTIDCEQWEEAHQLISEKLASNLILQRKYELLYELLKILSQNEEATENNHNTIKNWELNGGLYLDFINLNENFSQLLENNKGIHKHLQRYQNTKYDLIHHTSEVFSATEESSSSFSINSDDFNNTIEEPFTSHIEEIDHYLNIISSLLNRITTKKEEIYRDIHSSEHEKKLQSLEAMEETLLSAFYTCNDAKIEQRKQISVFDDKEAPTPKEEDDKEENNKDEDNNKETDDNKETESQSEAKEKVNVDVIIPGKNSNDSNKMNYQLLSDTSLTETKRSLMIDRLTDKWFNMTLDI